MKNITIRRDGLNVTVGKLSSNGMCMEWLERIFGLDGKIATLSDSRYKPNSDTREIAIINLGEDGFDVLLDGYRDQPDPNTAALLGDLPSGIYYLHTPRGKVKDITSELYSELDKMSNEVDVLAGKLESLRDKLVNA